MPWACSGSSCVLVTATMTNDTRSRVPALGLQDVTEENAELALGVKANKGLIPRGAQLPSKPSYCPS